MCTLQLKKNSGYQCEICLKKFSFPSKLTRHLFVHFDVKPYTCTICRKSFKQAYYLHKHLKVHTGKRNNKSRLCRVPQKHEAKPPTPGALEGTNNCRPDGGNVCLPQILDSLETKKHKKLECQSKLNQNVPLTESNSSTIEIKSSDALNYTEMQITTSSPSYLKRKQKGVNQSSVTTQSEGKDVNAKVLQRKNSNGNKRVYDCPVCQKRFGAPSKLKRHCLIHTNQRPFQCSMCCRAFRERYHLNRHCVTHTGQRPFQCTQCQKSFTKNSNGHKRVYDCPVCQKRFGAPSKLKRHCLIHTNQRPFQCSMCCRAFRERYHLNVHIRTHNVPNLKP
uniref:C2H2-type domain-containing protein n=1 Tax=Cyprinus carpio TaxID=7962 RepID=A0A8C2DMG3_CYPCA